MRRGGNPCDGDASTANVVAPATAANNRCCCWQGRGFRLTVVRKSCIVKKRGGRKKLDRNGRFSTILFIYHAAVVEVEAVASDCLHNLAKKRERKHSNDSIGNVLRKEISFEKSEGGFI